MSSTTRNIDERKALDGYYTDSALADAIVADLARRMSPSMILEPSAGHGAWVAACRKHWPKSLIIAIDIDESCESRCRKAGANGFVAADFLEWSAEQVAPAFDLVIGNPPFSKPSGRISKRTGKEILVTTAHEHIAAGWKQLRTHGALSFLLRFGLLGAAERWDFWGKLPLADVKHLVPRPSFTGGGNDSAEYVQVLLTEVGEGCSYSRLKWREGK